MSLNFNNNKNDDHLIPVLIEDTVQCVRFFPSKDIDYLASGGWDSKLRLYEINYQVTNQNYDKDIVKITSNPKDVCKHQAPILSIAWKGSSGTLITGTIDGSINYVDCQKNSLIKIGEHKFGCKDVLYLDNYEALLTGGFDGALKLWDFRAKDPVATYQFYNKIYSLSYKKNLLVLSLSEQVMSYFNLDNLQKSKFEPELIYASHIKTQIKKVLVLNNGKTYLEGSIEGRIAVKNVNFYLKPKIISDDNPGINNDNDFCFKCHREIKSQGNEKYVQVYPINDLCINPSSGSVVSAGSDGKYFIWDIEKKSKICEKDNSQDKTPLTACDVNNKGTLLAYASGYDWSKGAQCAHLYPQPKIFIHYLQTNERYSKNKY